MKHEQQVYSPYKELKITKLKFESNSGNFGEYTLTLSDDLKKINIFKETIDLSKKQILPLLFDNPNTYCDYNGHFKQFQFKIDQCWNNTSEARRNSWSDKDFNNFIFIFSDTALLDATTPNHVFGLTTATDTVISCDLREHLSWINYDHRKTNFLKNSKYAGLHVLTTSTELKQVRDILKDLGFEIPENTLYQFWNKFIYTFTFTKQDFFSY